VNVRRRPASNAWSSINLPCRGIGLPSKRPLKWIRPPGATVRDALSRTPARTRIAIGDEHARARSAGTLTITRSERL
jgi:hypothetical protein